MADTQSYLTLFSREQRLLVTRLTPEECCARLRASLGAKPRDIHDQAKGSCRGIVLPHQFLLQVRHSRNALADIGATWAEGRLCPTAAGTEIVVKLSVCSVIQMALLLILGAGAAALAVNAGKRSAVSVSHLLLCLAPPIILYLLFAWLHCRAPDDRAALLLFLRQTLAAEELSGELRPSPVISSRPEAPAGGTTGPYAGLSPRASPERDDTLGRPQGRNTLAFTDIIELWTWLVVVFVSLLGLGLLEGALLRPHPAAGPEHLPRGTAAVVLLIFCLIITHWLLLWRVIRRRRWACLFSILYTCLFFYPYEGCARWWSGLGAVLLLALAASVVVGWRELKSGW